MIMPSSDSPRVPSFSPFTRAIKVRRNEPSPPVSVRQCKRAPGAKPNGVRGIDRLQDWVALLALGGRHSNAWFLYSWLCHRSRIALLWCFGGHQSNGVFLTSWKPSLLAPMKSFFCLLRNSSKKSTANQTGLSRVSLLFGKDLPQVTIRLHARSAMALQQQRLIGWCHSHPIGLSHRCAFRSDRPKRRSSPGSLAPPPAPASALCAQRK